MKSEIVGVKSLEVRGLFRRFDHKVLFETESGLTIITAPNGYGKTVFLGILNAIVNKRFSFFRSIDFEEVILVFTNGQGIRIVKSSRTQDLLGDKSFVSDHVQLIPVGLGVDEEEYAYQHSEVDSLDSWIERTLPVHKVGHDMWLDHRSDEFFTTNELMEEYDHMLPSRLQSSLHKPDWIDEILDTVQCHLIETQRLLFLGEEEGGRVRSRRRRSASVVDKNAEHLSREISKTISSYASESQSLDQSFPKRIIENRNKSSVSESEIRDKLEKLNKKREELSEAGLIGESVGQLISPSDDLSDKEIIRILEIYIGDTDKKLGVFDEIFEKISIFKEIINNNFSFNSIGVDSRRGLYATDEDFGTNIELSDLSSGEQHELVLIYELLFNVAEGAVILIDEPELSLHVAWQKRFLSDIRKIQKIRDLQFVVATHSPQIINKNWNLVKNLSNGATDE